MERILFRWVYRLILHRGHTALQSVIIWNTKTKFLNKIRYKERDYGALSWQD